MKKKLRKIDIVIIVIVALLVFVPIGIQEVHNYKVRRLKKDVQKIIDIISEKQGSLSDMTEYTIDGVFQFDNQVYHDIQGSGVIFASKDDISVILSRDNMCGMKVPISKDIVINEEKCPTYKLFHGIRTMISTKGDGLYPVDYQYVYRGKGVNNYIRFHNELWRIVAFTEDGAIKIVRNEALNERVWSSTDSNFQEVYSYLNNTYYHTFTDKEKEVIADGLWNVGEFDITSDMKDDILNLEAKNPITAPIGLLSVSEYVDSSLGTCKNGNGRILCESGSYLGKTMWLSNRGEGNVYYVYKDGNIYSDKASSSKDIYPSLYLNRNVQIISGNGTSSDPYEIKE